MRKLSLIFFFLFTGNAITSSLPNCPSDVSARYHNCFGATTFTNGDKYVGEYKAGARHGQGTYTHASGDKYVGEWKYDAKHGQGTYTYANGDKYVGELKDGKKHGQGTYTFASGDKKVGEWKDDNFIKTAEQIKQERLREAEEEKQRIAKKTKYDKIYNACILDKSDGVDMKAPDLRNALVKTCRDIANNPSYLESWKYN